MNVYHNKMKFHRDSKQRPEEIIENRSHKKSRRYEAESLSSGETSLYFHHLEVNKKKTALIISFSISKLLFTEEGEEKRDRHGNKHTSVENQSNVETQRLNNDGENFQISDGQVRNDITEYMKTYGFK